MPRKIGLVGVDDVDRAFQGGPELALQGDQLGEGRRLDAEPEDADVERAVERATECDIERQRAAGRLDLDVARAARTTARCGSATASTRPASSRRAVQASRPDGTSTVTATSREPGSTATRPESIAHVTSAMVPWPQAVE